ncbi:MAG: hypothetical protein IJ346_03740 [Clostridia bacterium]|nr:hypothetical protein [Clostridia bacterium]
MSPLLDYKCPCCGGAIEFNTTAQKMKCPYCDTEFEMEALREYDQVLQDDAPDEMNWETNAGCEWQGEDENFVTYICQSCAGEIICDKTTAATSCPYCGNPVVMSGNLSGVLKPDYIIPFKFDKNAAKNGYFNHIKGKKLLPKIFKDANHIDEIKGMYVPVWLFDAGADANIRYRATRVRHWSDSNYNYTETKYYAILRGGNIAFERVPVDGSEKMDDALMESIEPYNFNEAVDFQTAYMAGYLADKYDVTAEESIGRANQRIKTSTEQAFRSTVQGYTTVMAENSNIRLNNGKAKYALYPVWILNTTYEGKKYTFAMNGQTGKFVGDLPCDMGLFRKYLFTIGGIASAAAFALSWLAYLIF